MYLLRLKGSDNVGMNDHRKTWRFEVNASPAECLDLFAESFGSSVGMLKAAKWRVERKRSSAVATYIGRSGLGSMMTKGDGAQVLFQIENSPSAGTICTMQLTEWTSRGPFVEDVGIIRKYMQNVGDHFRNRHPEVSISLA